MMKDPALGAGPPNQRDVMDGSDQAQEIKIIARPQMNPLKCDFEVDRAVHPGVAFFGDSDSAQGSPLPEKLFALEGVEQVLIRGPLVTVTKSEQASWTGLAKQVGATLRAHIGSGEPVLADGAGQDASRDQDIQDRVTACVEEEINPAVAAHGGYIEIAGVQSGIVYIRMGGGCQGCASSMATLRMGVEQAIRSRVPEVVDVLDVTDHAAGTNPYFTH